MSDGHSLAAQVLAALVARGETVAVAESLTGGLVAASLTSVAGSSAAFRGGVVAYATELKASLLGVDDSLLARSGPVDADVATAMARGVAERLQATYGIATTGVAGPGPQDDVPAGTVYVAVAGPSGAQVQPLDLAGDREAVRAAATAAALEALLALVG